MRNAKKSELDESVDSSVVAALRLSGKRFESKGLPVDSTSEVAALEDILRTLVKMFWLERFPHRKRIPKGFDQQITLNLTDIGPGSSVPILERQSEAVFDDLFSEQEVVEDYQRAVKLVEQFIEGVSSAPDLIPDEIRALPISKIRRFGQSLNRDEAIQVASTTSRDWDTQILYTPEIRNAVLIELTGAYTETATVDGKVTDFNVSTNSLTVADRHHGTAITIPYGDTPLNVNIEKSGQQFECRAEGIGEFTADGRLRKLISVATLDIIDITEDVRAVQRTLEQLAKLRPGWVDGDEGEAISSRTIEVSQVLVEQVIETGAVTRNVYPTEEGGIRFYWPESFNQLSIEVEPTGTLYIHSIEEQTFTEERLDTDAENTPERLKQWLERSAIDG